MTLDQAMIFAVLIATLVLFIHGRLRYDVVALLSLAAVGVLDLVPMADLFAGFGHPAVITVAAVLVISYALVNAGLVDVIARSLGRLGANPAALLVALTTIVALCSAFMNNVGALAVLMPVAIQIARKHKLPVSQLLMPLAFGSLLGGLMTLIGTPPNIIIAEFRARETGNAFTMFDFAPVGAAVALAGLVLIWLVGWRLLPDRKNQGSREELFDIDSYLAELHVPEKSDWAGKTLRELEKAVDVDFTIVGVVRGKRRIPAPSWREVLRENDVLIVETDADGLKAVMDGTGLELEADEELAARFLVSDEIVVMEAVVGPGSRIAGRSAEQLNLRRRRGINILAVARQGIKLNKRVQKVTLKAGDVLLLQGDSESMPDTLAKLGCLPLAERSLRLANERRVAISLGLFAIAIMFAATGVLPVALAFTLCVLGMLLLGLIALRDVYDSIDWSIIVLLGAMIPVGIALETTGAAQLLADGLLQVSIGQPAVVALALLMVVTMGLSNVINNAAAAVLMAPVAIAIAHGLGASVDPFLMGIAVAASSAFLTPIGHQSNTLVMGPGGYAFGDYWKLGLPVSICCLVVGIPMILAVWPM